MPGLEVVGRLADFEASVYRTDLHGNIVIETNGAAYSIITEFEVVPEPPDSPGPLIEPPPPMEEPPPPEPPPDVEEPQPGAMNVVINEVEANPEGRDAGYEWVELFNPLSEAVDLSGWGIESTHGDIESFTFQAGTIIEPNDHYVVQFPSQFVNNDDEELILFDESGNEVDRTPVLNDTENDGRTWQRRTDGYDNDENGDWLFRLATRDGEN